MPSPKNEDLLKIAEEALEAPLVSYYVGKVEQTAQTMVTSQSKEKWSLALVKMLLMAIHRARDLREELAELSKE